MKIRTSMVSNSSSSSFIIGVGVVNNEKALRKYLKESGLKDDDWNIEWDIQKATEYVESDVLEFSRDGDKVSVEGHVNSEPMVSLSNVKGKVVFGVSISNNEGDEEFWDGESDELDYSCVDETWFTGAQAKILELFITENKILQRSDYYLGAERCG